MNDRRDAPDDTMADSAWEGLAAGRLSRDEEAVLRALAEEGEDDAVRLEAYAPLDERFREGISERLATGIDASRRNRTRRRAFGAATAVLAAAAAVMLLALPPDALPRYVLEVRGATATVRGHAPESGPLRFDAHSVLTMLARPHERVEPPVVASVVVLAEGNARAIPAQIEVADSGAIRARVLGRDLPQSSTQTLTLALVIDRRAHTPREALAMLLEKDPRLVFVRLEHAQASP